MGTKPINFNDFNYKLGDRIALLRRQKNLTQEELGLLCNKDKGYISGIERGTRNPTIKILKDIADALEVTFEELFKGI